MAPAAGALGFSREAKADDKKAECASAYEKGQEQRAASKLRVARDSFAVCAQAACPSFMQSDCTQWLSELQHEMPTIVVTAKDRNGHDSAKVRVLVDGELLEPEVEGRAVAVDPGRHTFHFELEGAEPIDREIVIRQGEKDRVIDVSFAPEVQPPSASPYGASEGAPPPASGAREVQHDEVQHDEQTESSRPGPLRTYAYVAGGVGAAGILGFTILGLVGKGQQNDLESSGCKPNCSASTVSDIKTKYVLADVSLGIGIAGLGAGVALFFLSQPKPSRPASDAAAPVRFDVKTGHNATYATVSGRF
jgi:hypothetical protein